jgi:hypothetical protein
MSKTPVHWIIDIVPVMGLFLSAVIYFLRHKRDAHHPARPGSRHPGVGANEFARTPMQTSKFKGGALVDPSSGSSSDPFESAEGSQAWCGGQAKLLRIVERSERGEAEGHELQRAVADYDASRAAALASAKGR